MKLKTHTHESYLRPEELRVFVELVAVGSLLLLLEVELDLTVDVLLLLLVLF